MEMFDPVNFGLLVALGIVVGLVSTVLGLGGGIVMVPLLPNLIMSSQKEAIATSLATIFLVVVYNSWRFHKKRLVKWSAALMIGPFTAVTAMISARMTGMVSEYTLKVFLAVLILVFGLRLILQGKGPAPTKNWEKFKGVLYPFFGLLAGAVSGFSGIGSGLIISPTLLQLRLVPFDKVSPTANAVMVFTTGFGVLAFLMEDHTLRGGMVGSISIYAVLLIFVVSQISASWGREVQHKVPVNVKKFLLGLLLLVLGLKLLYEIA